MRQHHFAVGMILALVLGYWVLNLVAFFDCRDRGGVWIANQWACLKAERLP